MVDQLTDGRVEFGTGRSNAYEQTGQGIDPRETRDRWDEAITMLPQIWQSDEFSWEGKFWNVPPRRVLPKVCPETSSPHVSGLHSNRQFPFSSGKGDRRAVFLLLCCRHPGGAREGLP